jgi:hypothetical protein
MKILFFNFMLPRLVLSNKVFAMLFSFRILHFIVQVLHDKRTIFSEIWQHSGGYCFLISDPWRAIVDIDRPAPDIGMLLKQMLHDPVVTMRVNPYIPDPGLTISKCRIHDSFAPAV